MIQLLCIKLNRWIDYSTESRKVYIVELMECIRLGLLDTQFFLERVKDHPYVARCEASRPMIIETLKFLYDLEMITHRYFLTVPFLVTCTRNGTVEKNLKIRIRLPVEA